VRFTAFWRSAWSVALSVALALPSTAVCADPEPPGGLRVIVVNGEGGVNNFVRKQVAPVEVEVRDERSRPVPGARVRFTLPSIGPGGRFADGSRAAEVYSDERGRAAVGSFVPNEQEGRFSLLVDAISKGREASAVVSQTNARYVVPAPVSRGYELTSRGGRGGRTLALVVGVGAAAALGGVLALKGGGRPATAGPAAGPIGINIGGVSVGGPQ
jgi:hypothetical protein